MPFKLHALGLCVSILMVACGPVAETATVEGARTSLSNGDLVGAKQQLKQVLQQAPETIEARLMLAETLFLENNHVEAIVEYRKVKELGAPLPRWVPGLARSMLANGEHQKVIDEFGKTVLDGAAPSAELTASLATAYTLLGDHAKAQQLVEAALKGAPDNVPLMLAKVRMLGGEGKSDEALAGVETVLRNAPRSVDAWLLKGDLLTYAKRQNEAAVASYRQAVAIDAKSMRAQVSLITALVMLSDIDGASQQFESFRKIFPAHPQTAFFAAELAFMKGQHQQARALFTPLVQASPNNTLLLTLSAANELKLGNAPEAESLLVRAVKLAPNQLQPRHLLAQAYARMGQPSRSLEALKPLLARAPVDAESLYLAAVAHMQLGNAQVSESLLARAEVAAPDNARVKTAQAIRQLSRNADGALSALAAVAASDKSEIADLALIGLHVRRREFDKALLAVDALEKKLPEQALPAELRANVLHAKGDHAGARASLDLALKRSASYFPAITRLVALDLADKKPGDAIARLDGFIQANPRHVEALMAKAGLLTRQGRSEEVLETFRKAQQVAPGDPVPRVMQVTHLLTLGQVSQAHVVAQDAVAAMPNEPAVLEVLARSQVAKGELLQAVASLNKLVASQQSAVPPLLQLATVHALRGDATAANAALKRALEISPDNLQVQQQVIKLSLQQRNVEGALGVARSVQARMPSSPLGYALEGDILRSVNRWPAARQAYEQGMKKSPTQIGYLATKVHSALLAERKSEEAARYAETWLKQQPKDTWLRFHLGMVALQRKDLSAAEQLFKQVVDLNPAHAQAWNNLAWCLAETGRPDALAAADKALALVPDQPEFLDTRAHALAKKGDLPGAVDAARQAVSLAGPGHPALRIRLATLLVQSGDRPGAKSLLEQLVAESPEGAQGDEARRLLASL